MKKQIIDEPVQVMDEQVELEEILQPVDEVLVAEVIAGKWGAGDQLERQLLAHGHDPHSVAVEVDRIYPRRFLRGQRVQLADQEFEVVEDDYMSGIHCGKVLLQNRKCGKVLSRVQDVARL